MRSLSLYVLLIFFVMLHSQCASFKESPKYRFSDGLYKVRHGGQKEKAYITTNETDLKMYSRDKNRVIDTSRFQQLDLTGTERNGTPEDYLFSKTSFDIDLLNLPAKYRAKIGDMPPQLDAGLFNGAVYFGQRIDIYHFKRAENRIGNAHATLNHYSFSMGGFAGLGTTPMSQYVTRPLVDIEYSGIVFPAGITTLFTVNRLTFGVAGGVDHLLDQNKKNWIYQGKPWLGLAIGIHLN